MIRVRQAGTLGPQELSGESKEGGNEDIVITAFLAMAAWRADKFVRPDHAATANGSYWLGGLGHTAVYTIGVVESLLLAAFVFEIGR